MHKNFAVKVKNGDLQAILQQKSQYMEKICVMFFSRVLILHICSAVCAIFFGSLRSYTKPDTILLSDIIVEQLLSNKLLLNKQ